MVAPGFPVTADDPHKPFLLRHAASLANQGADVTVVAPAHPAAPAKHSVAAGLARQPSPHVAVERVRFAPPKLAARAALGDTYRRLRGAHGPWAVSMLAALTYRTAALARRTDADVIHGHWWYPGGLAAVLAGKLTKTPSVVHLHGSDVALTNSSGAKLLAAATMRAANQVLAVSEPLADETRERLSGTRAWNAAAKRVNTDRATPVDVRVVPMPVAPAHRSVMESSLLASSTTSELGIDVLGVGRFVEEKGFDVLIGAVAHAQRRSMARLRLTLIGDGPLRGDLAAQAARVGVDLHLTGQLAPHEVAAAYARARIVAVPSRREGFGLVAAEAVAAGRPVVATDVGGASGVLARSPHPASALVQPDDEAALAAALTDALAHPDHHNHYPVSVEPLSEHHHAQTLLRLYREAATR